MSKRVVAFKDKKVISDTVRWKYIFCK
jgi:hypothetical protein